MKISITIQGAQRTIKSMGKIRKWANIELKGLTFENAEKARKFAYKIAPHYTGALKQAIVTRASRKKGYSVVSKTPKRGNPRDFPYQIALHENKRGNYRGNRKSGDHQYMFTTFDWLQKTYPNDVAKELDKLLKSTFK